MPKYSFPTPRQVKDSVIDPRDIIFSNAEKELISEKTHEIFGKYGFKIQERQGFVSALRLHILGTTNYTVDQVMDLTKIPHDELMGYVNSFFNQMDDTAEGRTKEDCARALATTHKKAFEKINNYKIENIRTDNIEYMAKYLNTASILSSLYIEHSQNMQSLRNSDSVRQAYNSVYSPEKASVEENKLLSALSLIFRPVMNVINAYMEGNYKVAALNFALLRENVKNYNGKTVAELPLIANPTSLIFAGYMNSFVSDSTNDDFEKYLYGITGTFSGKENIQTFLDSVADPALSIAGRQAEEKLKKVLSHSVDSYASYFPEPVPDDLLTLDEEQIKKIERGYHLSLGQVYRAAEFVPAEEAGLDAFDLISTEEGTIRQIVGEKYRNYSPEQQMLALRLETMRQVLFNPNGVKLKYAEWKKNPENKWVSGVSDKTYEFKALANNLEIKLNANNGAINSVEAGKMIASPKKYLSQDPFLSQITFIRNMINDYFVHQNDILTAHRMDMFDCVYIGDQTVNELVAKRYPDLLSEMEERHHIDLCCAIMVAEGFNVNRPVFITNVKENQDNELIRTVVPVIFSGDGIEPVRNMQQAGMEDIIRQKANSILEERAARAEANREEEKKRIFESSLRTVKNLDRNSFHSNFVERTERIKRKLQFFQPASRKIFDEIYSRMEQAEADAIDACVRYDAYKHAAKTTTDDVLREFFEEEAENIKNSAAYKDYDDYITSLELSYKIKDESEMTEDEFVRINSFMEERLGHPVHMWPAITETKGRNTMFSPLTVKVGKAADKANNEKMIAEYLDIIYSNMNFRPFFSLGEEELNNQRISKFILVNGEILDDMISIPVQNMAASPNNYQQYIERLAEIIADAVKDGKPVDFYFSRARNKNLSTVPIRIESSDQVRLSEAQRTDFANRQSTGHQAMLTAHDHENHSKQDLQDMHDRFVSNAEERFAQLCKDEYLGTSNYKNNLLLPIQIRYFRPCKFPRVNKTDYPDPFGKEIRTERSTPIVYVICRLIEESLNNEKNGLPGYTIDQIISINDLSEQKQKYADEFKALCDKNDVATYGRNLIRITKAAFEYIDKHFPLENIANPDMDPDDMFLGKFGCLFQALYDSYQELKYNEKSILGQKAVDEKEFNEVAEKAGDLGKIAAANFGELIKKIQHVNTYDGLDDNRERETDLSYLVKREWVKSLIQANASIGREMYEFGEKAANPIDQGIFALPAMQNIMNLSEKDFLDRYNSGTILDSVFIDYDKYYRINKGIQTGDLNSCIVPVNSKEEKEALRRRSLEEIADYSEKEYLDNAFEKTASEREALFAKETQKNGLFEKTVFKNIDELSREEIEAAAQLYDRIFGKIMAREGVRTYLAQHPERTEFDFFRVGDRSVHEILNNAEEAPDMNGQNPVPGEDEILKRKAEIILASSNAEIPLIRETVRRDAQNNFVIAGKEDILGFTGIARVKKEFPELADLGAYRESLREKGVNTANLTDADQKELYASGLLQAASVTFAKEYLISENEFNNDLNDKDPQRQSFEKIKALYGAVPKYVIEWGSGQHPVYNKGEYAANIELVNKGNFAENEFATMVYLYTMSQDIQGNNPLNGDAFIRSQPNHMNAELLASVNNARKNTALAVSELGEGRKDPMVSLLSNGIKKTMDKIRTLESVSDPKGLFANYAYMLKQTSDLLDKEGMEAVKADVMNALTAEEKKDLEGIIRLKEVMDQKRVAEAKLDEYHDKHQKPTREEYKELLHSISNFNDYAEMWYQEHHQNPNAGIPFNLRAYLIDEELEGRDFDLASDLDKLFRSLSFMQEQVRAYTEADRMKLYEQGNIALTAEQVKHKFEQMTNAEYRYKQIREILRPHLTPELFSRARNHYQKYYPGSREMNDIRPEGFLSSQMNTYPAEPLNRFLELIFAELGKDISKYRTINAEIDAITLPAEKIENNRKQTLVTYPREEQIEQIKQNLANQMNGANGPALQEEGQIAANLQQFQRDIQILDEVKERLAMVNDDTKHYFDQISQTTVLPAADMQESKLSKGRLRNGNFDDLLVSRSAYRDVPLEGNPDTELQVLNYQKSDAWGAIRSNPVKASEDTRGKIAQIIHVMEGSGMLAEGGNVPAEEGGKVYGYRKLMDAKEALNQAVMSGDMDRIREANQEYTNRYDDVKLVQDMIRQMFPDLVAAPPNMDSNRNGSIPIEFMMDAKTESVMNSLYLLGNYCKKNGTTIEQVLENPVTEAERIAKNMVSNNGFNAKCWEFQNVSEAFNYYADYPIETSVLTEIFGVDSAYYGAMRPLEAIVYLEPDREIRNELNRQLILTGEIVETFGDEERELTETIRKFNSVNNYGEEANKRFRDGIKSALLSGGKLEKKHLPIVEYDEWGNEKPDAVNYDAELETRGKYADLRRIYDENWETAFENKRMAGILEETLFDYLKAHPEDMDKQEYKQFEKLAFSAKKDLEIESDLGTQFLQFKENYRQKTTELKNAIKTEEEAFNKDIVTIQKDLKKARKDQRNLNASQSDTVAIDAKVKRLENKLLNAIDKRLMQLNNDFILNKVSTSYLKARHKQLQDLKKDNANTDYLKIPEFAPANSPDAALDAKMIRGNVIGGLYSGYLKDLESFKNWKMHEEVVFNDAGGSIQERIEYENQLTKEQWQKEYEKEIIRRGALPQGVTSNATIARNVQIRNAEFEKSVSTEDVILSQRRGNERNIPIVIEANVNETIAERKQAMSQKFQNGQAANHYIAALNEMVVPAFINAEQLDVNNGNLFVNTDPMGEMFYYDVAEIIALGIVENRDGKVPGGNLQDFITRIASDIEFRKTLLPIAEKLKDELAVPVGENGQREHYWGDQLVKMLDDRTIVKAYAAQKNAVKAGNDMANDGIFKMQEAVNKAEEAKNAPQVAFYYGQQPVAAAGGPGNQQGIVQQHNAQPQEVPLRQGHANPPQGGQHVNPQQGAVQPGNPPQGGQHVNPQGGQGGVQQHPQPQPNHGGGHHM